MGKWETARNYPKRGWRRDGHSRKLELYLHSFCCQEEVLQQERDDLMSLSQMPSAWGPALAYDGAVVCGDGLPGAPSLRRLRTASYWEGSAADMMPHTSAMPTLNAKGQKRPRNNFNGSGRFSISTARLRHPKRNVMRIPMEPASLEVLKREQSMKTRWICKNRNFLQSLKEINILNSSTSICQANRYLVSWVCVVKYTKVLLSGLI